MFLSDRLLKVSTFIPAGAVVFDVGTDHAFLPCFLVKEGICEKVYASDNKEGPLSKAKESIEKYGLKGKVIPMLGNGIDNIPEDADVITICGMGFNTVKEILNNKDLTSYKRIIVQVNKGVEELREYISENRYSIVDEGIVYDDFYYQIIVFNTDYHDAYSDDEISFGPILLGRKEPCFKQYLMKQIEKYENIGKFNSSYINEAERIKNIITCYNL